MNKAKKFVALVANPDVLDKAEALAKDILRPDRVIDNMVTVLIEAHHGTVTEDNPEGLFTDSDVVRDGLSFLLSVSGVKRKDMESVSAKNAYDYRVRTVVQKVSEILGFTTPDKPFDLDKVVGRLVKRLDKAVADGKTDQDAVREGVCKIAEHYGIA